MKIFIAIVGYFLIVLSIAIGWFWTSRFSYHDGDGARLADSWADLLSRYAIPMAITGIVLIIISSFVKEKR